MGTEWDDFSRESHIVNVTGEALKNRMLLQGIMRMHGFIGYSKEWWHFQLPNARGQAWFVLQHGLALQPLCTMTMQAVHCE